jgi:hypothetical protein
MASEGRYPSGSESTSSNVAESPFLTTLTLGFFGVPFVGFGEDEVIVAVDVQLLFDGVAEGSVIIPWTRDSGVVGGTADDGDSGVGTL